MNKVMNFIICAATIVLLAAQGIYAQELIVPGQEFRNTDHLAEGKSEYIIQFERSGWETHEAGVIEREMVQAGDSLLLIRKVTRGKISSKDTLVMNRESLQPISLSALQSDRKTHYTSTDQSVTAEIRFPEQGDTLNYTRNSDHLFFDISSLELVLGAFNRRDLDGKTIHLFDHQTSSFINFKINEVERERIKDASGNRHRCFKISGKLNRANATYWIDRRSGELIKSHLEMTGNMAMMTLKK